MKIRLLFARTLTLIIAILSLVLILNSLALPGSVLTMQVLASTPKTIEITGSTQEERIASMQAAFKIAFKQHLNELVLIIDYEDYKLTVSTFYNQINTRINEYIAGIINAVKINTEHDNNTGRYIQIWNFEWQESEAETAAVYANAKAFLNSPYYKSLTTDDSRLSAINEHIAFSFEYDAKLQNFTAYSMIQTGKGVCEAYAQYGYAILSLAGYKVRTVMSRSFYNSESDSFVSYKSEANNGDGSGYAGHAWNLVQVGKNWYHLDFTWCDTDNSSIESKDYFMLSDSQINQDHRWSEPYNNFYPAASKTWVSDKLVPATPTPKPTVTPTPKLTAAPTQAPTTQTTVIPTFAPTTQVTIESTNTTVTSANMVESTSGLPWEIWRAIIAFIVISVLLIGTIIWLLRSMKR